DSRQALAREFCEGRRLVPAHAAHGVVVLPRGVASCLPRSGAGASGPVDQPRHGLVPGDSPVSVDEGLGPVLAFPIAAAVDEVLEQTVGHLVLIEPESTPLDSLALDIGRTASNEDHPLRYGAYAVQ